MANARGNSPLHSKQPIEDPSKRVIDANVSVFEWHMQSRKFGMPTEQLERLQEKLVENHKVLTSNLLVWKFVNAYSILQ
jgi:hypothetical protein